MAIHKLEQVNAFVARDFAPETPAIGIVRAAPKILQGGAKELARAQTYQCAFFGHKIGGASAGISAPVDEHPAAIAAFVDEVLPHVAQGHLMINPGKGVNQGDLAPLLAVDHRHEQVTAAQGADPFPTWTAASAAAAARAAHPLDGADVAIEGFGTVGLAIAERMAIAGARIVAISTPSGTAESSDGFAIEHLRSGWADAGADLVGTLVDEPGPAWKIMGSSCQILFTGSKMGALDHKAAEHVSAKVVVPHAPIPYTTKGAIMLGRQGVMVVPDIVATAGPLLAGQTEGPTSSLADVEARIEALTAELMTHEAGAILGACHKAEDFLATWQDTLPFGRPFAP